VNLTGRTIGNYVVKAELGRGGMGVVYLGEHPVIGRRIALKVLHFELAANPEMVQRLYQEAKAAGEIDSEHVVEVVDFGPLDLDGRSTVYLAMELLDGESLGRRAWRGAISIADALEIVGQCCSALAAAHASGIVHRDLKPENIFMVRRDDGANFVKILDFGIAKLTASPYTRTRTGMLLGTPAYMSPEQCRGTGPVDHRSDVYSLGAVLYELVTGKVPFAAQGYGDVLLAHLTQAPAAPTLINPECSPEVEALILRALDKAPERRFQSTQEMAAAIELALRDAPLTARRRPGGDPTTRRTLVPAPTDPDPEPLGASAEARAAAPADDLHARATILRDGGLHAHTTLLKPPAETAPLERSTPLGKRLTGVRLTAAVDDTGELQQISELRMKALAKQRQDGHRVLRPARLRLIAFGVTAALLMLALAVWAALHAR
jgi:serine/threonine-protein kinase